MVNSFGLTLPIPCVYDGEPLELQNDTNLKTLRQYVPELVRNENSKFCCDDDQVIQISNQMSIPQKFLERCPSCLYNFVRLFYFMTCSPYQHDFVRVTKSAKVQEGKKVVEQQYYITEQFGHGLYNSCAEVQMPSVAGKVIPTVMCGKKPNNESCSAEYFLKSIGNYDPSPMQIDFILGGSTGDASIAPNNNTIFKCSQAVSTFKNRTCACQDCQSTCPPSIPIPGDPMPWKLFGVDGMALLMALVYLLIFLLSVASFVYYYRHLNIEDASSLHPNAEPSEVNPSQVDHSQIATETAGENLLGRLFGAYGALCATRPYCFILPFIGLTLAIGLSTGVHRFDPITDPISLWSTPTSRARVEKKYFDTNFGPFFRPETVVMTPSNLDSVEYNGTLYGPVFNQSFLLAALRLQEHIMSITIAGQNGTISVEDLCFAPMNNHICMVQSALGWFQNSAKMIDRPDYIDHMLNCISNPTDFKDSLGLRCMAPYGGPVFPHVALADFEGKQYWKAKSLVFTITLNNAIKEADNANALTWEFEFLELLHNYSDPSFSLAFYSEVRIRAMSHFHLFIESFITCPTAILNSDRLRTN